MQPASWTAPSLHRASTVAPPWARLHEGACRTVRALLAGTGGGLRGRPARQRTVVEVSDLDNPRGIA